MIKLAAVKWLLMLLLMIPAAAYADGGNESGNSFGSAKKKLLKQIHYDHQIAFYSGCTYSIKVVDGKEKTIPDWATCGFKPRKQVKRGSRIEWEHVMPAWAFGHQLQCWQDGGRKACNKNKAFKQMASDMHNLQPAIGEINGDRNNYSFTMLPGEARVYGDVDFEVDFKAKKAEPPASVRGDIARTYFYMRDTYGIQLSKKQTQLFNAWAKTDTVDEWELARMCRIASIQGNANSFVGSCD